MAEELLVAEEEGLFGLQLVGNLGSVVGSGLLLALPFLSSK